MAIIKIIMYCIFLSMLTLIFHCITKIQIAGASLFGIFLSKYEPVTCLKLAASLMIWSLPVVVLSCLAIVRVLDMETLFIF